MPSQPIDLEPDIDSSERDAPAKMLGEFRRLSGAVEAAIAEQRQASRQASWFSRHQAWTIAIAAAIVSIASWSVSIWQREQVLEVQAPIDARQDAEIKRVDTRIDTETKTIGATLDELQRNDEDLAEYALEADQYEQAVLDQMAAKLRVKERDRPSRRELEQATKRLRAIKDRGRSQ